MKWFVKYTLTSELLIVESHVETANFECKEEFGASNVGSSFMSETVRTQLWLTTCTTDPYLNAVVSTR
jgi:hypothetical protein